MTGLREGRMFYRIRHLTEFHYSGPIRESVMELRMQPRSDGPQRCRHFTLQLEPDARSHSYTDFLGNIVHHFDIPSIHDHLRVEATAVVEILPHSVAAYSEPTAWSGLDRIRTSAAYWDWLQPSAVAHPTERLRALVEELKVRRRDDPIAVLRELNSGLHRTLAYDKSATRVDSPVDACLERRRGVCQDFAHVFIAIARGLGIPCRYVSGYLFHRPGQVDHGGEDATHAWVEAFVPDAGWVGFDPSNNISVGGDHIRVAVGRDYQDVPPNRGVFKGVADAKLKVNVEVRESQETIAA